MNLPDCPEHPKSKRRRFGTYGTRKRQRFWCAGDGGHTFTEALPRQMTAAGDCLECERHLAQHEGPPTPRLGTYTVREIAAALMRVGEGMSYRAAGKFVRRRAGRTVNGEGRLVADWVETYAPLLYQPSTPTAWPDVLLIDEIPFHIRWQNRPSGRQPYSILGAMEWRPDGQHRLIRLEARGGAGKQDWIEFLSALPGTPRRIVCDAAKPPQAAIAAVWGTQAPAVFLCHWHLARRFRELLKRSGLIGHPIETLLESAFSGPVEWSAFTAAARTLPAPTIQTWLRAHDQRVSWQVVNMKREAASTGPLESALRAIRDTLTYRRFSLRNRERLNRWLMLWMLNANGQADERAYAGLIRSTLESQGGTPPPRRAVLDPRGVSSLWR